MMCSSAPDDDIGHEYFYHNFMIAHVILKDSIFTLHEKHIIGINFRLHNMFTA